MSLQKEKGEQGLQKGCFRGEAPLNDLTVAKKELLRQF